ncbi:MAG: hypothetical protein HY720_20405 [Planctomycetes bacterium]|nr:hypothetical protein [Planctomycetota bacterium]
MRTIEEWGRTRKVVLLVLVSFVSLFLELALIRWVSAEIRIFAYCKNLVLLAAFFGLGWGFFRADRPIRFLPAFLILTALVLAVEFPHASVEYYGPRSVTRTLSIFSDIQIFNDSLQENSWTAIGWVAFGTAWTAAVFFGIAAICIPYGQMTGRIMGAFRVRLAAYSLNVAGALLGILGFTCVSLASLPPAVWFAAALLLSLPFLARRLFVALGLACTGLVAGICLYHPAGHQEIWSLYQKLIVEKETGTVSVNNTGYMTARPAPVFRGQETPVDRFTMGFLTNRGCPRKVLVVGAGVGNDVAVALAAGAEEIVAVEIDPVIHRTGTWLHPDRPYDSSKVRVVIDDARHFFKTTEDDFDLIMFSHLDSHTLLSGYTNVRLDNYIYTVESFREAKDLLRGGGLVYVSFWAEKEWIVDRLHRNLSEAFGHAPLTLVHHDRPDEGKVSLVQYLTGSEPVGPDLLDRRYTGWENYEVRSIEEGEIPPSSDDWPFLYVEKKRIPLLVWILSAIIFLVSALLVGREIAVERGVQGHFFFLGAAFLLVEVHNVSKLALLFGTTWWVNTWVIASILFMVLLANAFVTRFRPASLRLHYALLAASLAGAYFLPLGALSHLAAAWRVATSLFVLSLPIFFAGVIFAVSFSGTERVGGALGSNMLGAILGGLLESLSFVWGLRSLVMVAAALYGLSYVVLCRRARAAL